MESEILFDTLTAKKQRIEIGFRKIALNNQMAILSSESEDDEHLSNSESYPRPLYCREIPTKSK
jgi:hypothetical protein